MPGGDVLLGDRRRTFGFVLFCFVVESRSCAGLLSRGRTSHRRERGWKVQ